MVTKKLLFFGRPLEALKGDVRRGRHRDASHSAGRDRLDEGPVLRQDRSRGAMGSYGSMDDIPWYFFLGIILEMETKTG